MQRSAVRAVVPVTTAFVVLAALTWLPVTSPRAAAGLLQIAQELHARAQRDGHVRVIVEVNLQADRFVPEARLQSAAGVLSQRRAIAAAAGRILSKLPPGQRLMHRYQTVPFLALEVSAGALTALENSQSDVLRVLDAVPAWGKLAA